ncbi:HET-domain-containing protein [Aspergillus sclerotioniger CBS 115572]|uniref:HET-domain-containing protein n=1 Tax=Aspergillus sclerotioniger CBS 115572 TaxID=1450535 RepID=A0A317W9Y8_9EURO|nr:HET-domain-containing protein [Aspergillus sclerotioniger CBS 115572]PWY80880.1 HET-domain-containing protein [Aspergillus sclerotioniger CBS 115572]
MSRWHPPSCVTPDVVIDGGIPHCRGCGHHCNWQDWISSTVDSCAPPPIPPDEPPGQLNLRWPPSVPYFRPEDSTAGPNVHQSDLSSRTSDSNTVIYGARLSPEEIRLADLSPGEENAPIHISLGRQILAGCLDYETVSYMWGGEDGDYTLCCPVFVGPHWDLMLQTKNCWEMLKTMRFPDGARTIWVDALCINQRDDTERGQQVANMKRIYEQCSRVLVYLGNDLVSPSKGRPSRRLLQDLEASTQPAIQPHEILQRKYFSRIWVIQELVLPHRIIFRLGDTEFWVDSRTMPRLSQRVWGWQSSNAPWVEHMTNGALPVRGTQDLFSLTGRSEASDPRDKVFGVVGLFPDDLEDLATLVPDYSISVQHLLIGMFAFSIIREKRVILFLIAPGLSTTASQPSWVPDWGRSKHWPSLFTVRTPTADELASSIHRLTSTGYDSDLKAFWDNCRTSYWVADVCERRPWDQDIIVHAHTGALSICLTHICALRSTPHLIQHVNSVALYEFQGEVASIYLASELQLDTVLEPLRDHLFVLLPNTDDTPTYSLVGCDIHLYFAFQQRVGSILHLAVTSVPDELANMRTRLESPTDHEKLNYYRNKPLMRNLLTFFPDLKTFWDIWPLFRAMQEGYTSPLFHTSYLSCVHPSSHARVSDGFFELTFPEVLMRLQYSPWGLFSISEYSTQYDSDVFADCIPSDFPTSLANLQGHWEIYNDGQWNEIVRLYYQARRRHSDTVEMRAPTWLLWGLLDVWFKPCVRLQRVLGCSVDEVEALLRQDHVDDELHLVGCPPLELQDDFGADFNTYQVHIL